MRNLQRNACPSHLGLCSYVLFFAVWVWCGDEAACGDNYKHCWLKHLPWVYAIKPRTGADIPWTSGLLEAPQGIANPDKAAFGGKERKYHTVTTAQGKGTQWQMRVHYYWFKKQQKACREKYGDKCQMGGFTRLLHSGFDDELSAEIPTYVVNPLPSGSNGYVVRISLSTSCSTSAQCATTTGHSDVVVLRHARHAAVQVLAQPLQRLPRAADRPSARPAGAQPPVRFPPVDAAGDDRGGVHPHVGA